MENFFTIVDKCIVTKAKKYFYVYVFSSIGLIIACFIDFYEYLILNALYYSSKNLQINSLHLSQHFQIVIIGYTHRIILRQNSEKKLLKRP